jgi:hypothetical protein
LARLLEYSGARPDASDMFGLCPPSAAVLNEKPHWANEEWGKKRKIQFQFETKFPVFVFLVFLFLVGEDFVSVVWCDFHPGKEEISNEKLQMKNACSLDCFTPPSQSTGAAQTLSLGDG